MNSRIREEKNVTVIHRLGKGMDGNIILGRGWGEPERGFVWSEGKYSELNVPAFPGSNELLISAWGYVGPKINTQEVMVFIEGSLCGYFEVNAKSVVHVSFQNQQTASYLKVAFYIPSAKSPQDAEGLPDNRCLGIALATVEINSDASTGV